MSEDQAFVVMQIGAKDSPERRRADEIFNFVVKPALAEHKVKAYRADLDPTPGAITAKLLDELLRSRLVIADLTGRNPNVFYELGIAHSFGRPLISIADSVDSLPFDAKDERVIELGPYVDSGLTYAQGESSKTSLLASLKVVLADGYIPPSPLRDVAGTQSLDALAPENPFASELSQMKETIDEIRAVVTPRTRPVVPRSIRSDINQVRSAIAQLLVSGTISLRDLPEMVSDQTSGDHDAWVESLGGIVVEDKISVGTPDPWGPSSTRSDPWEQPSVETPWSNREEPPF